MTFDDYAEHVSDFTNEMTTVTGKKNPDYSVGDDDAMGNFKIIAEDADVTPLKAWSVLFFKHVTAIMSYVRKGKLMDESIHSRFIDLANYCMLGDALIRDLTSEPMEATASEGPVNETVDRRTERADSTRNVLDELERSLSAAAKAKCNCPVCRAERGEIKVPAGINKWVSENFDGLDLTQLIRTGIAGQR